MRVDLQTEERNSAYLGCDHHRATINGIGREQSMKHAVNRNESGSVTTCYMGT